MWEVNLTYDRLIIVSVCMYIRMTLNFKFMHVSLRLLLRQHAKKLTFLAMSDEGVPNDCSFKHHHHHYQHFICMIVCIWTHHSCHLKMNHLDVLVNLLNRLFINETRNISISIYSHSHIYMLHSHVAIFCSACDVFL